MKRAAAGERIVLMPPVIRVVIVQVELALVSIAPEIQGMRVAIRIA